MFSEEELQRLFRYSCVLTGEEQDAYDLLQDAVETCLRRPPKQQEKLMSYSRSIIRNRFIDQYRRKQRYPQDSLEDESVALDMDVRMLEDIVIDQNELDNVWQLLQPLDREILFLWAVEEYTTGEIAVQLEIPRGSILSRIHRLRQKLQTSRNVTGLENNT